MVHKKISSDNGFSHVPECDTRTVQCTCYSKINVIFSCLECIKSYHIIFMKTQRVAHIKFIEIDKKDIFDELICTKHCDATRLGFYLFLYIFFQLVSLS